MIALIIAVNQNTDITVSHVTGISVENKVLTAHNVMYEPKMYNDTQAINAPTMTPPVIFSGANVNGPIFIKTPIQCLYSIT
jgi:hypothetical protein